MIEQSKVLEVQNLAALAQLQHAAPQKSRSTAKTGPACVADLAPPKKGTLPQLSQLRSSGTTLRERIKNYRSNLSAIETPVVDDIQDTTSRIRFDTALLAR